MLFPYTHVPHPIEKMQAFIDFIFFEVWCQAPVSGPFSLDLFNPNPELHEVMTAFHYDDSRGAEFFSGHVERIYGLFAVLSAGQIDQFRQRYRANNDIESVCANDPAASVMRYADFPGELEDVRDQLASFFKRVYSYLDVAALKAKTGAIDDHYRAFMAANQADVCPFCGIADLLGEYHSKRDAYDHYLPKALYPFNSANFKNLVPACHHCNSSYKTSKDPAYTPKDPAGGAHRRAAFYPYAEAPYAIQLRVTLLQSDIEKLTPADLDLQFGPDDLSEKIETWRNVYGIDERYKAKFCGKQNGGRYWLDQMLGEWRYLGRDPSDYMAALAWHTQCSPYADCNFLKKAFLDGCHATGIFNAAQLVS
ncbi:MAG: hypothetical protein KDH15_10765 [Rhodocyclaceae bacterium]|nr:hypothetical protein [Rhodocyclaceae bacterium]